MHTEEDMDRLLWWGVERGTISTFARLFLMGIEHHLERSLPYDFREAIL